MANQLDELDQNLIADEGVDVHVIAKRIPVTVGKGSLVFEIILWVLGIIPGLIFLFMKISAKNYFQKLEQKLQHDASQIDNYLDQRDIILSNCVRLVERAVALDRSTFENIAKYRSGMDTSPETTRSEYANQLDSMARSIQIAVENYPNLQAHQQIADAMRQNLYLQREITAARELYNDTVNTWNREIFSWPTKQIVAARNGYTTRLPFIASAETKKRASGVYF